MAVLIQVYYHLIYQLMKVVVDQKNWQIFKEFGDDVQLVTATGLCITLNVLTVHFVKLRHVSAVPNVKRDYA